MSRLKTSDGTFSLFLHSMVSGKGRGILPIPSYIPYDREAAVHYAHRWAYGRNPRFYNYDTLGGDCTNFASQCLYAGTGIMNYTPIYGWYYINANDKAPESLTNGALFTVTATETGV